MQNIKLNDFLSYVRPYTWLQTAWTVRKQHIRTVRIILPACSHVDVIGALKRTLDHAWTFFTDFLAASSCVFILRALCHEPVQVQLAPVVLHFRRRWRRWPEWRPCRPESSGFGATTTTADCIVLADHAARGAFGYESEQLPLHEAARDWVHLHRANLCRACPQHLLPIVDHVGKWKSMIGVEMCYWSFLRHARAPGT